MNTKHLIWVMLVAMASSASRAQSSSDSLVSNEYQRGKLKDGYKTGYWEYFDRPGELSLKINYNTGQLLYLIPDSSEYVIFENGIWQKSKLDIQPRYIGSMVEFYKIIESNFNTKLLKSDKNDSGNLYVMFEVDTMGHAGNFMVSNSPSIKCTEEIIRVLNMIPNLWISGMKENRNYAARLIIPFKEPSTEILANDEAKILDPVFPRKKQNLHIAQYDTVAEVMPSYTGGEIKMQSFINRNLNYPE